jgi:hypothetical protein
MQANVPNAREDNGINGGAALEASVNRVSG